MLRTISLLLCAAAGTSAQLRVCATTPNLGALVRAIGGKAVEVTVFAKPLADPHYVEAKPSYVRALNEAHLYVQVGLALERAWAPSLLRGARNRRVLPGNPGYLDTGRLIRPLEIPTGEVTRAMGDIHPYGNPHFLADPLRGLQVAAALRDRLTALAPAKERLFAANYQRLERRLATTLLGEAMVQTYGSEGALKVLRLFARGRLVAFLKKQKHTKLLGGLVKELLPHRDAPVVADHNLWPYFAQRFRIRVVGFLEPRPGIPPTTRHLTELVARIRREGVRVILAAPYYNPRYAELLARRTGARIAPMAHQVGSRPGTEDYVAFVAYNLRTLARAFAREP